VESRCNAAESGLSGIRRASATVMIAVKRIQSFSEDICVSIKFKISLFDGISDMEWP
jgi:hypothetical protein